MAVRDMSFWQRRLYATPFPPPPLRLRGRFDIKVGRPYSLEGGGEGVTFSTFLTKGLFDFVIRSACPYRRLSYKGRMAPLTPGHLDKLDIVQKLARSKNGH